MAHASPSPTPEYPTVTGETAINALHNLIGLQDSTKFALFEVAAERASQDNRWGEQNHQPFEWLSILGEEVGEACQAANKAHWSAGAFTWADYRTELMQVAAVALAAIECLDRHNGEVQA